MKRSLVLLTLLALALLGLATSAGPAHAAPNFDPHPVQPPPLPSQRSGLSAAAVADINPANAYADRQFPSLPTGYSQLNYQATVESTNFGYGLFYAHSFGFTGSTNRGYAGFQTRLYMGGPTPPGAIASAWGASSCSANAAQGASCWAFNEGGAGWSIHYAFNWVPGRMYVMNVGMAADGRSVGFYLVDSVSHGQVTLGRLFFPTAYGRLLDFTQQWTEYYSPKPLGACPAIGSKYRLLTWTKMQRASDFAWVPPASTNRYIQPNTGCVNSSSVDVGDGSSRLTVGT